MSYKKLTVQVVDGGLGYPGPRVLTPMGEDITMCLTSMQMNPLTASELPTMKFEAYFTTDPQHEDPVVDRLTRAINLSVKKHLQEMAQSRRAA